LQVMATMTTRRCPRTIHLCEAISEGFSPSPRISALNLPLGVTIEVLDENLCDVIQGTLRLRAMTLLSFLADAVGHHELIEFAQPPVGIKVNAVSLEVPENLGLPPNLTTTLRK